MTKKAKVLLCSLIAVLAIGVTAFMTVSSAHAECYVPTGCASESGDDAGIQRMTSGIYAIVVDCASAVGAVAAAMVMWASIQYSISLGNPGKAQKAKSTIIYAAIGVLLGFGANIIVGIAVGIGSQLTSGASIAAIINTIGGYIRNITLAAGVMAVMVGGFMMVSSAGNPGKVQNGKKAIIAGIIGVLIAAFAHVLTIILVIVFNGGGVSGNTYTVLHYEENGETRTVSQPNVTESIDSHSVGVEACLNAEPGKSEAECVETVKTEARAVQQCLGQDPSNTFEQCRSDAGANYVTYPEVFEYGNQEKILCHGVTKKYVLDKANGVREENFRVRYVTEDGTSSTKTMSPEEIDINMSTKCEDSIDANGQFIGGQVSYSPTLGTSINGRPQYKYSNTICTPGENKVVCEIHYVVDSCPESSSFVYVQDDFGGSEDKVYRNGKGLLCQDNPADSGRYSDEQLRGWGYEFVNTTTTRYGNEGYETIIHHYRPLSSGGGN